MKRPSLPRLIDRGRRPLTNALFTTVALGAVIAPGTVPSADAKTPAPPKRLGNWSFTEQDIHGRAVSSRFFRGKVTVVFFSTRETESEAGVVGQRLAERFADHPAYQTLVVPSTAELSFLLKPFADQGVRDAEQRQVEDALARRRRRGLPGDARDVRSRLCFIHDRDGSIWARFGLSPASEHAFVGIFDDSGSLVHLRSTAKEDPSIHSAIQSRLARFDGEAPPTT